MRKFEVGDIIELATGHGVSVRVRGVVVAGKEDRAADNRCVMFNPPFRSINQDVYTSQRGWFVFDGYNPHLVEPTEEEEVLAMRILLTGYLPGVDGDG